MTRRGTREPPAENQSPAPDRKAPRFAETLKREFRELVKALTCETPAPVPQRRRRTTDDTGRAFIAAARNIMRRAVMLPAAAYAAACFLSDTLDWLNPWHHEIATELDENFQQPPPQPYLYPHL